MKALYYLVIKNAKIDNINGFLKDGDTSSINYPTPKKPKSLPSSTKTVKYSSLLDKNSIRIRKKEPLPQTCAISPEATQDTSPTIKFISSSSVDRNFSDNIDKATSVEMVEDILLDKLRVY